MPTPQESLDRALERWNAGDLEGYLELYADDATIHGLAPEPVGKDEARAFYSAMHAALDSPQLTLRRGPLVAATTPAPSASR